MRNQAVGIIMEMQEARCNLLISGGLQTVSANSLPPPDANKLRVVAISDTHLVHDQLQLPDGDVLVHAGDILTESLLRHVDDKRGARGTLSRLFGGSDGEESSPQFVASEKGVALFEKFAQWFCNQKHTFKVLIAGNHDGVLEAMGAERIRAILDKFTAKGQEGSIVYLEHEHAELPGCIKVFGSPFGHWGSHNNAFSATEDHVLQLDSDLDILVTHSPPVLPSRDGGLRKHGNVVDLLSKTQCQLSISGHCHWAYNAYYPQGHSKTAYIVASSCDSKWQKGMSLQGERYDKVGVST